MQIIETERNKVNVKNVTVGGKSWKVKSKDNLLIIN